MQRTIVLVDGFNLFHALDYAPKRPPASRYHKYKWISLKGLAQAYLTKTDTLEAVYYFTTLATWRPKSVVKHRLFIQAQQHEGVRVVYGEFKQKQRFCPLCHGLVMTHEEKQTDVNIAITLLQLAAQNAFDKAILISGDTDLLPAIKAVQTTFPTKKVGAVIPIGRFSEELRKKTDFHFKMKELHLQQALLPDPVVLPTGKKLRCPPTWK